MSQYQMHAVIAIAGVPTRDGKVYTEEQLRRAADGRRYQWEDSVKALFYYGPNLNGAVYVVPTRLTWRNWIAPLPSFAHYWRLQKLYFVAGIASLPVAAIGAYLMVEYGKTTGRLAATIIVGFIVGQLAWRWADKRMAKVPYST